MPPFAKHPVDESDSIDSEKSSVKLAKKSVRFANDRHVRMIQNWCNCIPDRSIIWFTPLELSQIAQRDRILMELMRQKRFHESDDHSSRGLPIDPDRDLKIRQLASAIVVAEQFRQLACGCNNPEELAAISRTMSENHVKIALKRAEDDLSASVQAILESLSQKVTSPQSSQEDQSTPANVRESVEQLPRKSSDVSRSPSRSDSNKSTESKILLRPELCPRRRHNVNIYGDSLEYANVHETCEPGVISSATFDEKLDWVWCGEWVGRKPSTDPLPSPVSSGWMLWNGAKEMVQKSGWVSCGTWDDSNWMR